MKMKLFSQRPAACFGEDLTLDANGAMPIRSGRWPWPVAVQLPGVASVG